MHARHRLESLRGQHALLSGAACVLRGVRDFFRRDGDAVRVFDGQDSADAVSRKEAPELQHRHADARRHCGLLRRRGLSRRGKGRTERSRSTCTVVARLLLILK